jgi:hypothetical protein
VKQLLIAVMLVCLLGGIGYTSQRSPDTKTGSCEIVDDALRSYSNLKTGMTRRDLEQNFTPDGGFGMPSEARYVFRKCHNIKVTVNFELNPDAKIAATSPSDTITKLSTLYLAYESRD